MRGDPRQAHETARLLRELAKRLSDLPRSMPEFQTEQELFDWLDEHRSDINRQHWQLGENLKVLRVFPVLTRPRPFERGDLVPFQATCPHCGYEGTVKVGRVREAVTIRVGCPRCYEGFDWNENTFA